MMQHRRGRRILPLLLILAIPAALPALTLKIGTVAPADSPWAGVLHKLAGQIETLSGGDIVMRVYAGGIAGDEPDIIRKMRIGQLQGAALTQLALGDIVPEILALNVPYMIHTDGEFQYLLHKMRPSFEEQFRRQGYVLLTWFGAGWVHFFARGPLTTPDDLRAMRLGVPTGSDQILQEWKALGFDTVSLPISDIMTGLQTGSVDAFYAPPSAAAIFQWFLSAAHMSPLKVTPVIVGLLIEERTWRQIPEGVRSEIWQAVKGDERGIIKQTENLDPEAIRAMQRAGLTVDPTPPDAVKAWERVGVEGANALIGKLFPRSVYDEVLHDLEEYRASHPGE